MSESPSLAQKNCKDCTLKFFLGPCAPLDGIGHVRDCHSNDQCRSSENRKSTMLTAEPMVCASRYSWSEGSPENVLLRLRCCSAISSNGRVRAFSMPPARMN